MSIQKSITGAVQSVAGGIALTKALSKKEAEVPQAEAPKAEAPKQQEPTEQAELPMTAKIAKAGMDEVMQSAYKRTVGMSQQRQNALNARLNRARRSLELTRNERAQYDYYKTIYDKQAMETELRSEAGRLNSEIRKMREGGVPNGKQRG